MKLLRNEHIVDWYDAIVEGFLDDCGSWRYCSLVAWDPGRRVRAFAVLPVSAEWIKVTGILQELERGSLCNSAAADFLRTLRDLVISIKGDVAVVMCEHIDGPALSVVSVSIQEVAPMIGSGVEAALRPKRVGRWLPLSSKGAAGT